MPILGIIAKDVDWIRNRKTPQINSLINRFTLPPNILIFDYEIKELEYEKIVEIPQGKLNI